MSTGGTAPPAVVATLISPMTASDSTMSSPLSEVKDADPDEMDEDHIGHLPQNHDASDSTSNLSDIHSDPPESEAETDRLFDTPQKPTHHKDVFVDHNNEAKIFERSPSKLQQELVLDFTPKAGPSRPSSPHFPFQAACSPAHSQAPTRPSDNEAPTKPQPEAKPVELHTDAAEFDSKKRKRSTAPDDSDSDAPLRKRTASVQAPEKNTASTESLAPEETATSSHEQSGEHSAAEDETPAATEKQKVEPPRPVPTEQADQVTPDTARSKKRKRGSTRKRKSPADTDNTDVDHAHDTHDEETVPVADEGSMNRVEEDHMDVDGENEADLAHKNEEELEKKRLAFDQLTAIEKHFVAFRDRLYEERLEQLNKEEAMLQGENPTHPEYLAMMQCVNTRLQEQLRHAESHLKHDMESLNTWAVARRGQIMSQYHQGVRASRERALSDLGKQWYEIQYERRRRADSTPDFGIRFPTQRPQQIRHAVAYNKEVSILAGVAKYQGFPAAPELNGAVPSEVDDDFDAITRARQPLPSVVHQFHEYGVSNRVLGPAGEQFIEQTPWANPNHPSHQVPRNHHVQAEDTPLPRRQLSQQNPFAIQGSVPGLLSNGQLSRKASSRAHHHGSELPGGAHADHPMGHIKGGGKATADMAVKPETLAPAAMV